MSSNRNTIIHYMGYYFVLPRDPPSEITYLGEEARRRFNWHLVTLWYQRHCEAKAGKQIAAYELTGDGSGNKFTNLSNSIRDTLLFAAMDATLRNVNRGVVCLDVDSGQYHMPTDIAVGNRQRSNSQNNRFYKGIIETLV